MTDSNAYETPDHRPLAVHISPGGHEREYIYGEFDDFEDDRWDVCWACGGGSGEYPDCEFDFLDSTLGCPRMTGSF